MATITVEVDGLGVEVDADDWAADHELVMWKVRAAREALRLPELEAEARDLNYTELYGQDA